MNEGYPRFCGRCAAPIHVPDPPHLCADLRKRLKRQEEAIELVAGIIEGHIGSRLNSPVDARTTAIAIVRALAGRDLGT